MMALREFFLKVSSFKFNLSLAFISYKKINNFKDSNALGDIIDNQIKKESEISRSYLNVKYALRPQKYDLAHCSSRHKQRLMDNSLYNRH